MDTITVVLLFLLAVVISNAIARMSPVALPLPLVQIALGAVIASVANLGVELKPDIFFLLFLPPLLFLDGWRIPKEGLFRDKGTILELALGLVVFTVVGVGYFINWMIPAMPLARRLRAGGDRLADRSDRCVRDRRPRADPQTADAYSRGRVAAQRRLGSCLHALRHRGSPDRRVLARLTPPARFSGSQSAASP